ncbi:DUF397 domain-containing protein [Amycolatopsis sp. CA-230715]|uniref:DUF397 domain-containing protein n=1 Tax=Amycolatopsis sp. CA-230715 TaxID=2745196 RepID=UPI001C00BA1E|nr:DUF397 domain-containing protein [Amycolatopsis sp. CA-230715]QWF82298.1 hypothetical protein HUW46_05735 [Amycolatopsis sp. CA-230715]
MITLEPGGLTWRTSSYSAGNGNCVEIGWRTSSYTGAGGAGDNNCVEVWDSMSQVRIRDTKDRLGGELSFDHAPWRTFLRAAAWAVPATS